MPFLYSIQNVIYSIEYGRTSGRYCHHFEDTSEDLLRHKMAEVLLRLMRLCFRVIEVLRTALCVANAFGYCALFSVIFSFPLKGHSVTKCYIYQHLLLWPSATHFVSLILSELPFPSVIKSQCISYPLQLKMWKSLEAQGLWSTVLLLKCQCSFEFEVLQSAV